MQAPPHGAFRGSWWSLAAWGCAALLGHSGCSDPPPPRAPVSVRATKSSLYGNVALVPTRAAEHARAELSVAAELQTALLSLPGVHDATVAVRVPAASPLLARRASVAPTTALITTALAHDVDVDAHRAEAMALAATWLGPGAQIQLSAHSASDNDPDDPGAPDRPWAWLALCLIGLGASAGVTLDRALERQRRRRPRR